MLNKLLTAVVASSIILGASVAQAKDEKTHEMAPAAGMEHKDCKAMTGDDKANCMKEMKKAHAAKKMEKKSEGMKDEMKQ